VAFSNLIPLVATGIAVGAGQEAMTPALGLGAAAVLCGVVVAQRA
jgi:drug/metabolite transporter (DMT)-like permease